jgi:AcrR family transcriptional regulator
MPFVTESPSTAPPPTRRERRRERTRAALLDAARALITEKGVAGLRIQEITDGADVALGSFYNHFESKEELVEAVVAESLGSLADALATPLAADQDPAELVGIAIRRFMSVAYDDPDFARLVVHLNHVDDLFVTAVHPGARRAVQLGIESGRFDVPDLEVSVTGIVGGALAIMRAIVDGRLGVGADAVYARAALRAFGVPDAEAADIVARPLPNGGVPTRS